MPSFDVRFQSDGWHISDGRIDFGPYSTRDKAEDSAAELNRQAQRRAAGRASAQRRSTVSG